MKKLFLVDAYALIFKYYYAFLGRSMRNRRNTERWQQCLQFQQWRWE